MGMGVVVGEALFGLLLLLDGATFGLLRRLPGELRIFMQSRLRRRRRGGLPRTWGLIFGGFGLAMMGGG